jgi:hypothetical protein
MFKSKSSLYFFLALVLLTVGIIIYRFSDRNQSFRAMETDFSVPATHTVSRIEMINRASNDTLFLELKESGRWMLNNGLHANELAVKDLLSALSRLRVRQPVSISESNTINQILDNEAVEVSVFVDAYRIHMGNLKLFPYQRRYQHFLVGSNTPDGESTFMRKHSSEMAFVVYRPGFQSGVSSLFSARLLAWIDPVVIDLSADQIASVEVTVFSEEVNSYILENSPTRGFSIFPLVTKDTLAADNFDSTRVARFLASFQNLYFERMLDEDGEKKRKELMFEQPEMKIIVESVSGNRTSLLFYSRKNPEGDSVLSGNLKHDPNRFYLKINDEDYTLAQYFVFNRIMRPLSFFQNKP